VDGFLVHPLVGIPITAIATFVLAAVTAALLRAIPFLRRTVQ